MILVGTLFNDIKITRTDENGDTVALLKVPIIYGPKDKMLARIMQDPGIDRQTAMLPSPMISFEMGEMVYDGNRKLPTINKSVISSDGNTMKYQYNPVPYNITFRAYVYAKNAEDGAKIIEQIVPFFTPDWTTTVMLIPEMDDKRDIPVVLNKVTQEDKYDSSFTERRSIIWSLDMTLKGYIFGPVKNSGVIKFAKMNFYLPSVADGELISAVGNTVIAERVTVQPGLTANGLPTTQISETIPYAQIEADDDYGIISLLYNTDEIT